MKSDRTGLEIAAIGMSGRFPGAGCIAEFWHNLCRGVEAITFIEDHEFEAMNIDPETKGDPNYVRSRGGLLENKEYFDAGFFGYSPAEADIMDPQLRIFHECTWEALEDAAYDPRTYNGLIGIFAGASSSMYWEALVQMTAAHNGFGSFALSQYTHKDFLSTRIAYQLDLKGPSFLMDTACSTSLAALHLACQAVLNGECDMALAGGVSASMQPVQGYLYREGMIWSKDGHCRPFDSQSSGTRRGEGAGVVLVKPLESAEADGDHIYALVKGTSVNNDGRKKGGYAAPSWQGQANAIRTAQRVASVAAESITYLETHGTGTTLGDSIEVKGLKHAFNTPKRGFCCLGSVKANIGHLDAAAGIAGFIKTVLALHHRMRPPSINFTSPQRELHLDESPFYIDTGLNEWTADPYPRRAGVSSFGIGGTNVHVVLEESPSVADRRDAGSSKEFYLLTLSAGTPSALNRSVENLARFLEETGETNLADMTYTLQVGRRAFPYRRWAVCADMEQALARLSLMKEWPPPAKGEEPYIVFMFSGQGSQYVGMGLDLYRSEKIFRDEAEQCFDILQTIMEEDLRDILYPADNCGAAEEKLNQFIYTSPIKFLFEYALARLLIHWGIEPRAMIGHSFGEYTAACLAGVFSLEDALKLSVLRGEVLHRLPEGAMLSVSLGEAELLPLLAEDISLAAVNSPGHCIVSGPPASIAALEAYLNERSYECKRLRVPRAGHSWMVEPFLEAFREEISGIKLQAPRIPFVSGVSGTWITADEAVDPGYWARHLRETVRFADGLARLLKPNKGLFIQVGADRSLGTWLEQHPRNGPRHQVVNLVRHPKEEVSDYYFLLRGVGAMWQSGVKMDWTRFHSHEKRRRISLPTYPFERRPHGVTGDPFRSGAEIFAGGAPGAGNRGSTSKTYVPTWIRDSLTPAATGSESGRTSWLVFLDSRGLGERLAAKLGQTGDRVVTVKPGTAFSREADGTFRLNMAAAAQYDSLFQQLRERRLMPDKIIHLWSLDSLLHSGTDPAGVKEIVSGGLFGLLFLVQAWGRQVETSRLHLEVIANNMHEVTGGDSLNPLLTILLGLVRTVPREYENISSRCIDINFPPDEDNSSEELLSSLLSQVNRDPVDPLVVLRGPYCWRPTLQPLTLPNSGTANLPLRKGGVYLITGGMGGVGLALAEYLAGRVGARLILTGRSAIPRREHWQEWLRTHPAADGTSETIRSLQKLESLGGKVLAFSADVCDAQQMADVIGKSEKEFGSVNGIIHAAGIMGGGIIQLKTAAALREALAAKVDGSLVIAELFKEHSLEFMLLCSSLSAFSPRLGQMDYCAANAFLDAFAHFRSRRAGFTVAVNWERWKNLGMSRAIEENHKQLTGGELEGMSVAEGTGIFASIVTAALPQVLVSRTDLEQWRPSAGPKPDENHRELEALSPAAPRPPAEVSVRRPELSTPYAPPADDTEKKLVDIWGNFFRYEGVGVEDDFFELGGDSLKASILVSRIRKEFQVKIPLTEVFQNPTIRGLSTFLKSTLKAHQAAVQPEENRQYYPLSSSQKRMYVLHQVERRSLNYNVPMSMELIGTVDRNLLEAAAGELIRRHEGLRTSVQLAGDRPVQKVHADVPFTLEYNEADEGRAGEIIDRFVRPFDLRRPPLFRIGLIKINDKRHIFLFDFHHIVVDGTSKSIFTRELMTFYSGVALPKLRLQFKDFALRQHKFLDSVEIGKQEQFWLKHFEGKIPLLNLPADYPRPPVQSFDGDTIHFEIAAHETRALKELARHENATLYIVLLAIFNVLLARLSGQEDIVVGTPVSGRGGGEFKDTIGMFTNTLAQRNFPRGEKSFVGFLREVRQRTLSAYENQDYPFERLVSKILNERDVSRNPLFDAMFAMQNFEDVPGMVPPVTVEGLTLKPYKYLRQATIFDINLNGGEIEDRLQFTFEYSTRLFRKETAGRMVNYFKEIVTAVLRDKNISLKDIILSHDLLETAKSVPEIEFSF